MLKENIGRRPKRSATGPVSSAPANRPNSDAPPRSPIQTGLKPSRGAARIRAMPMIPSPKPSLNTPPVLATAIRK